MKKQASQTLGETPDSHHAALGMCCKQVIANQPVVIVSLGMLNLTCSCSVCI